MVLHNNKNYEVRELDFDYGDGEGNNYGVYNKATGCMERACQNLPEALVIAEQFNYLLESDHHIEVLKSMFGEDYADVGNQLELEIVPPKEFPH